MCSTQRTSALCHQTLLSSAFTLPGCPRCGALGAERHRGPTASPAVLQPGPCRSSPVREMTVRKAGKGVLLLPLPCAWSPAVFFFPSLATGLRAQRVLTSQTLPAPRCVPQPLAAIFIFCFLLLCVGGDNAYICMYGCMCVDTRC